ncbi:MAG TPA: bifunctional phosphopantothenoylcysteine decarboxylase/phosphopantothenate--cysteine ligase CoaBC [Patescibacteria group bacterium]|nr:bifunctional phosphopantothenoylcysteine decarboxylase/phosphopantothenate--cysteine ligase CoaBC [Patescibacteria group bacterium]
MQKKVLLGVTSGIAAYKSLDLIKLLQEEGIEVSVILTKHATQMVPQEEFEKITGGKVYTELFEKGFDYQDVLKNRSVDHIDLADNADLLAIVPATANIIAKIAHGVAEDFLTTTTLAMRAPILLAPSMNVNMWQNPLVQENVTKLTSLGYHIVEPVEGMLACGYEAKGRLEDVEVIKAAILSHLSRSDILKGKKVIVTAGGTMENIDDVRSITNKSSGKMGAAIAEACLQLGAEVVLLRAKTAVEGRFGIKQTLFETADELFDLIKHELPNTDIVFHTAAVSDFQLAEKITGKISSEQSIALQLTPRIKISDQIKKIKPDVRLVIFKAEHNLTEEELQKEAQTKLQQSDADAVVANDIGKPDRGFQAETNEVIVVLKNGESHLLLLDSKRNIAKALVTLLLDNNVL